MFVDSQFDLVKSKFQINSVGGLSTAETQCVNVSRNLLKACNDTLISFTFHSSPTQVGS